MYATFLLIIFMTAWLMHRYDLCEVIISLHFILAGPGYPILKK